MTRVGIREFRAHMGEYLRRVKAGEVIEITKRGKPVGRLMPAVQPKDERDAEAKLLEMVAQGKAYWSGKKLRPRQPVAKMPPGVSLSDLIVQERDESLSRFERHR